MLSLVPMSEKRVPLNSKVKPEIKAAVEKFARKERRSVNNLAEILLEWALIQLERSGSTLALLEQGIASSTEARAKHQVDVETRASESVRRTRKRAANE